MRIFFRLAPVVFIALLAPVQGNPPAWWREGDSPVIVPPTPDNNNNHGSANIGQAKFMAKRALEALSVAVGANVDIQAQVVTVIQQELYKPAEDSQQGVFFPLRPDEPTDTWIEAQKALLQIGALKALAAPFYRHLSIMNATWVKGQLIANGLTLGTDFFQDGDGTYYPWNPADNTNTVKNHAPATIGQLKAVFSLRYDTLLTPSPVPDPLLPEVILVAPAAYTIADQATLNARVTPKGDASISLVTLNGQTLPASSGDSSPAVTLVNGLNTFILVATDSAGRSGSATATITRDTTLPTLAITSPANGAVIGASCINILGTIGSAIPLQSVTVNGVSAYINVGTFEAPNLPVIDGANTFTATATDILGKVTTAAITVTGQPPVDSTSVAVTATPSVGDAPLTVTFHVVATVPGTIQIVTYDFEGSGKNLVTATAIAPLDHLYPSAGIYYPRVTIRTTAGTFSNPTGPSVPVANRLRVEVTGGGDGPIAAWSKIKSCVAAGDFEAASNCLSYSHRDGIKAMLVNLGPRLGTTMLTDFGELQQITLNDDVATYAGEISLPEGYVTFTVDFIKEGGSWKIFSF